MGLAAAALTDNPKFPTYPNPPTSSEISSGLAAAYAAQTLLGQGGAVALLIVLFMAVTSCASAELIAVSSLLTFDVYKTYIQPKATPKQLILVRNHAVRRPVGKPKYYPGGISQGIANRLRSALPHPS
jgi:Na+/proline symporter